MNNATKQRYISTSFWDDPWIRKLAPGERYAYLYLMTNTLTNIAGVYQISLDRICFDTSFSEEKVREILSVFEKAGKAYFYSEEYIVLPKWPKHQKWESKPKIKAGIEAVLKVLPAELLKFLKNIGYVYPIDTLCIPYVYEPRYSEFESDIDVDVDCEKPDEQPDQPTTAEPTTTFLEIQEKAKKASFYLSEKQAKAFHCLDPTWLTGEFSFIAFAAERICEDGEYSQKPHGEQERIFAKAWGYQNLVDEFPAWREAKRKATEARALKELRKTPPEKCQCGNDIRGVCSKCGGKYFFCEEKKAWEFVSGEEMKAKINTLRRVK